MINKIEIEMEVPEWEIDTENSTDEQIVLRKIKPPKPKSVTEIPNRNWFIDSHGNIESFNDDIHGNDINNLSTENRAEAFLALMQLVELRDAWNNKQNPEWKYYINNDTTKINEDKYCIKIIEKKLEIIKYHSTKSVLYFKDRETAEEFKNEFEELIWKAEELL